MVITDVNQVVYNGDGSTAAWPFTFRIIDATDIKLTIIDTDGTETDVVSDYYVDVANNTVYYPGYAPGAEPPEADQPAPVQAGQKLLIYRELPITQEKNLGEKWPFNVIELGLDKLTMILQQISGWWDRCLKISAADEATHPGFDLTFPIEAGKSFRINADATGFEVSDDPGPYAAIAAEAAETAAEAAEAAEAAAALVDVQAFWFDSVADMRAANLPVGATAGTKGYYTVNDGGAQIYTVRAREDTDVDDGKNIIFLDNGNVAELINPENYLPFGYTRTTYTKTGVGTSNVYYSIIPKEYQPELTLGDDTLNTVENAEKKAYEDKSSLTINGGVFTMATGVCGGVVIKDGQVLQNNDVTADHWGRSSDVAALYMLADGTLNSIETIDTPTSNITALNPVWAVQGWYPIILEGVNVSTRHSDDDYQPLTCIGQDYDGNYFAMVVEGRSPYSIGMSLPDVYDFVTNQLGLSLKFLYNLDGGGSSTFVYHGIRRNELVDYEDRPVPTFITFRKKEINSDDDFANMYALAQEEQVKRQKRSFVLNQLTLYSRSNGQNGINFYSVDKTTQPYTYTREYLLGPNYTDNTFVFDTNVGGAMSNVFKIDSNDDMIFHNAYHVPAIPREINITWGDGITASDTDICRYGDLICLHAKLTISSTLPQYSSVLDGLPYMHSNYLSIPLFNVGTGAVYIVSAHWNGTKTTTSAAAAIPAGTYILDTNYPAYNH